MSARYPADRNPMDEVESGASALPTAAFVPAASSPIGLAPTGLQSPSGERIQRALGNKLAGFYPVGSRITCEPPPDGTDEDWLVLCRGDVAEEMRADGFGQDGSPQFYTGNDNGGFRSWRDGDLNVVTTESAEFFDLFLTATDLAKRFNLLAKADRIALFQAVLYGVRSQNLEQRPYVRTIS